MIPRSTGGPAPFLPTRWTLVAVANSSDDASARAALEELCGAYWMPLYAWVRRRGHSREDAKDLTQAFFARLLEKDYLQAADREKGKFRTFLLTAMQRFLANEWRDRQRLKRGGGADHVAFDTSVAETLYAGSGDGESPEQMFDRRWAMTLLENTLERVRGEFTEAGKGEDYEVMAPCLTAARGEINYAELATKLGANPGAARVAIHRLRRRFRDLFREEVARTVRDDAEVEEEMRHIQASLG